MTCSAGACQLFRPFHLEKRDRKNSLLQPVLILKKNLGSFATMGFGSSWVCFDFDFDFDLFVVDGSVEAD